MAEQIQQRQIAFKKRIADLIKGSYVKEEGWNPNYVLTGDGTKVSRVNLVGTVVSVPVSDSSFASIILDDGSASISVRSFDNPSVFSSLSLGDAVFVIGRPRQYGNETYIAPEIIKKVKDRGWIKVRALELGDIKKDEAAEEKQEPVHEDEFVEEDGNVSGSSKVYLLIKELDTGNGALFEDVLEKSGIPEAEKIISRLLMEGEIFEVGKGRLKALE